VRRVSRMILSMLALFFILLFLGMPIAYTMGLVSIAMLLFSGISLEIVVQRMFAGVNSFSYLAIPLFILAGNIMGKGGLTRRLMNLAHVVVGKLTGGLDRKSTRLNSSHVSTSYAVFCLKQKN